MKKSYQIGKVCELTGLAHSTIRFWEKHFPSLTPARSSGGHRYYNEEQIDLLNFLKKLLHEEGYTIEGAKKRISMADKPAPEELKEFIKSELKQILSILNKSS